LLFGENTKSGGKREEKKSPKEDFSEDAGLAEEVDDGVTDLGCELDSRDLGDVLHPQRRNGVVLSESRGLVAVCHDDSLLAVEAEVLLEGLFGDFGNLAEILLVSLEEIVSLDESACRDKSLLSEDEVLWGETEGVGAGGGDLESVRERDVRDCAFRMLSREKGLEGHVLVEVGDLSVLVEALGSRAGGLYRSRSSSRVGLASRWKAGGRSTSAASSSAVNVHIES